MKKVYLKCTFSFAGILSGDWLVNIPSQICAMTGSSVVLPCSYDFPQSRDGQEIHVKSEMWCLGNGRCITPRYVYHSAGILQEPSYQSRVQYLGEIGSKNCSLEISGLQESDSGTYVFYLITNHTREKMPTQRGLQLLVSVLAGPSPVIEEGESVSLSCCSPGSNAEVLWFKSSSSEPKYNGAEWTITKTTHEDAGGYYCQVRAKDQVQKSKELVLDVQYPPRNTIISISPPEQTEVGRPATLTCKSAANPPVLTYTWYKGAACGPGADTSVYKYVQSSAEVIERDLSLSRINISVDQSEEHCCVSRNRHGSQKSSVQVSPLRKDWRSLKTERTVTHTKRALIQDCPIPRDRLFLLHNLKITGLI
uniref:Ig-like domain-containing protein n=1 Tax=Neogobius melanostomus TaxID=47308 RepID=A0A8C6SFB9_9GOBI